MPVDDDVVKTFAKLFAADPALQKAIADPEATLPTETLKDNVGRVAHWLLAVIDVATTSTHNGKAKGKANKSAAGKVRSLPRGFDPSTNLALIAIKVRAACNLGGAKDLKTYFERQVHRRVAAEESRAS